MPYKHTEVIMQLKIKDIIIPALDRFIGNHDMDKYAKVSYNSPKDVIVDLVINVISFALDDTNILIEFPNHNIATFQMSNNEYSSIEII